MRYLIAAVALGASVIPALAGEDDLVTTRSPHDVATTMDRLEAAVTGAGATVVARVDHAGAAQGADMELAPNEVLIFGNPAIGTPAMQDNALAGLFLPLRVLAYQDAEGQTWLAYQDPAEIVGELDGISEDASYIEAMTGALRNLTTQAAAE
ncbi:MAG: DUF302 domain-containing protein [Rhodobacterales bacterium]